MAKKSRNGQYSNQNRMADQLDKLAAYDDYAENVLPRLQKAIKERWSVEKMYAEFQPMVAARMITAALSDPDSGKSLQAAKEILDRSLGKSTERIETTHKYSKLSDLELDNLLASTLESSKGDDEALPN